MSPTKLALSTALSALAMLAACGEEHTTEVTGMKVVAEGEDMPKCSKDNIGEMIFAADSAEVYYCAGDSWNTLKGEKGNEGAQGEKGDKGDTGEKGDTGDKGEKGDTGNQGEKGDTGDKGDKGDRGDTGDQGASCTANVVPAGIVVYCDDELVGSILHGAQGETGDRGKQGEKGDKGDTGAGCTATKQADGKIEVKCGDNDPVTLYMAMCGTQSYDPSEKLCYNSKLYGRDQAVYDSDNQVMVDPRDGHIYKTTTIGTQTWMAQNLNYDVHNDRIWCYNEVDGECDILGRAYQWNVAIDSVALANDPVNPVNCGSGVTCEQLTFVQGACPNGWHLPLKEEFETLFSFIGASAGKALKSTTGWAGDGNGTDKYNFNAIPKLSLNQYKEMSYNSNEIAGFWTATQYDLTNTTYKGYPYQATYAKLSYNSEDAITTNGSKNYHLAVRCLLNSKDDSQE